MGSKCYTLDNCFDRLAGAFAMHTSDSDSANPDLWGPIVLFCELAYFSEKIETRERCLV
jgi:hypothetical protein